MKRTIKNDVILIGVILAVALLGFGIFLLLQQQGNVVSVQVDGKEVARYKLSEDIGVAINAEGTGSVSSEAASNVYTYTHILKIENGEASVVTAECPDRICVEHKPVSNEGETIVCLPYKVVIIVE